MVSGEPLLQKSAGPPSGAGFHPEAGWSPSPAVRGRASETGRWISLPRSDLRRRWFGKRLVLFFRPGDVVGDNGHDRYFRHADKDLREQRTRTPHQFEMSDKGKENTHAGHRERLLNANDTGIGHLP